MSPESVQQNVVAENSPTDQQVESSPRSAAKLPWTPEELAVLGTMPDTEAARRLNRAISAVRSKRQQLHILDVNAPKPWTDEQVKLVGTLPDLEVARILGRSLSSVRRKRDALGHRAPGQKTHWNDEELRLLGTVSDQEAARLTNRSYKAVQYKRVSLGVPMLDPRLNAWKDKNAGQRVNREGVSWSREEEALLGTMPDTKLARKLGRSAKAVRAKRPQKRIWFAMNPRTPEDDQI